ncbi:4-hydroxy-tetrahydrodipicolinate synthase [Candidatus Spongiihabitans sp.]|uniref:4-hydroxy-tetrahydrodipicolinate synthase n=1 Tax=Candidatus Spongiihabitans sp. TaxID=3101308 RepID=UPI003C7013F1
MLKGSLVALITPMEEDGSIDYSGLEKLIDFHVENQTDGIISVGTSGESATLDIDQQLEVIGKTVEMAAGRIPVIAGTGGNSTSEAVELTSRAAQLEVHACLLVVPYYNKPTQHGLYQHFEYIAETVDIPQILYNVPGRTALDMNNDTVADLSRIPNIVGIKDATGDISRVAEFVSRCGPDFALYSGDDATTLEFITAGGHGCISVTANVAPQLMHEMCIAAIAGDLARARELNNQLAPLHAALFLESNPIPAKWALYEMGYATKGIRLPLTAFSGKYHDQLRAAMAHAHVSAQII